MIPMKKAFLLRLSFAVQCAGMAMLIGTLAIPLTGSPSTKALENLQARFEQEIESARLVQQLETIALPLTSGNAELLLASLHNPDPLVQIVAAHKCAVLGTKADLGEALISSLRSLSQDDNQHPKLRAMCLLAEKQIEIKDTPAEKSISALEELLAPDSEFQRSALRPMYYIIQEGNILPSLESLFPVSFETQNSIGIYYALKRQYSGSDPAQVASLIYILKTQHDTNPGRCLAAIACLIDIGPQAVTALLEQTIPVNVTSDSFFFYSYTVEVCKGVSDPQAQALLRAIADMPRRKDITGDGWIPFSYLQHRARTAIQWIESQTPYLYKYRNIFGWEKRERVGQ